MQAVVLTTEWTGQAGTADGLGRHLEELLYSN